jgi:peptidyl-tRNA hydrolase, PTH1 family
MFCVAGLGNPGEKYSSTRHNLGFRVAEELAESCHTSIRRREFRALTAVVTIGRSEVLLLKPETFMNVSGESVASACKGLGIPPDHVIVVYDDADLAAGRLRVRRGGGAGGHRGVASIIETLGSSDFVRLRLGIGRPPAGRELADWVLEQVSDAERRDLDALVRRAGDAVREVVANGAEQAMQKFNGVPATNETES